MNAICQNQKAITDGSGAASFFKEDEFSEKAISTLAAIKSCIDRRRAQGVCEEVITQYKYRIVHKVWTMAGETFKHAIMGL